jgi:hypothetical protein
LVGTYVVYKYEVGDTTKQGVELPTLQLRKDQTFTLLVKNIKIVGNWRVVDVGDYTLAEFKFNNSVHQTIVLGDNLEILEVNNPYEFYCPFLKSLSFRRVD